MSLFLQSPYIYIIGVLCFSLLFWLCLRYRAAVQKITMYVAALTILGVLAYTALALFTMLMRQP